MAGDSGYDMDEPYQGSYLPIKTEGLTASNPNWKGTPTIYSDDKGNVRGVYTSAGVVPVESLYPLVKKGERITADTLVQETGEGGAKLYLRDPNDPESKTYENTGIPAIAGTVAQQGYVPPKNNSAFGTFTSDIGGMLRDPAFHKFLAASAAIAGGGLALNSAYGVGGLGATATASPVSLGGLSTGSALGAPIGSGSLTAGITPSSVAAFEAGLPTAIGSAGAPAAAGALGGLTGQQAMQLARMVLPALGAATGGAGAGGGSGGGNTSLSRTTVNQYAPLGNPTAFYTGAPDSSAPSGIIDYKPLAFMTPKESQLIDVDEGELIGNPTLAAKGGEMRKSMERHAELRDIEPQLLNMIMSRMAFRDGDKVHIPEFITGATGHYVKGKGDGQSDDIPAMLADGEFVWDADTVAQLGNGSSDAGAKFLDEFRKAIRAHKRSAPNDKIPPKASPLQYVKEAMKNTQKA